MVLVMTPALEGLKPQWGEAAENLGASRWHYWRYVAGPVLLPSFLGSVLLLFCSSFSAYATAYAINSSFPLVTIRIQSVLSGNVLSGPGEPRRRAGPGHDRHRAAADGHLPAAAAPDVAVAGMTHGRYRRRRRRSPTSRLPRLRRSRAPPPAQGGPAPRADRDLHVAAIYFIGPLHRRDQLHVQDPHGGISFTAYRQIFTTRPTGRSASPTALVYSLEIARRHDRGHAGADAADPAAAAPAAAALARHSSRSSRCCRWCSRRSCSSSASATSTRWAAPKCTAPAAAVSLRTSCATSATTATRCCWRCCT